MDLDPQLYPRTYRQTAFVRWLNWVVIAGIAMLLAGPFLFSPPLQHAPLPRQLAFAGLAFALFGGLLVFGVVDNVRNRIVLTADSISIIGGLSAPRTIRRADIAGVQWTSYRNRNGETNPLIVLVTRPGGREDVRIRTAEYDVDASFNAWLSGFTDLTPAPPPE